MRKEECGYWPNWIVSFSSLSSCDTSTSGLSFHILWKVDLEQWFMLSSWSSQVPSNWPFESLITIDCRWWSRWYLAKCGEKLQVRKEASFVPTPAAETKGLSSTRWVIRQFKIFWSPRMSFHISPAKPLPLTDGDSWPTALMLWKRDVREHRRGESLPNSFWF